MPKLTKDDLLEIIQQFSSLDITKLELKIEGVSLELEKEKELVEQTASNFEMPAPKMSPEPQEICMHYQVKSPMVGVFYEAPEPGAEPFVKIGDTVEEGQTLYIIEAMKMIHEIASPVSGEIINILPEDGEVVEYSQVVMEIEEC